MTYRSVGREEGVFNQSCAHKVRQPIAFHGATPSLGIYRVFFPLHPLLLLLPLFLHTYQCSRSSCQQSIAAADDVSRQLGHVLELAAPAAPDVEYAR